MDSRAMTRAAAYAVPGLALAAAGLFHPHSLNPSSADMWFWLHVVGLPVFPLVGLALALLVRHRTDPAAWLVRVAAFVYATFYTALDVISGIGAGYVTRELGAAATPRPDEISLMFRIGTPLGEVGSWALLVAVVVLLVDAVRRLGGPGLSALLLVPGAWLVHVDHIFSPGGAVGMALLGLGTATLAALGHRDRDRAADSAVPPHGGMMA